MGVTFKFREEEASEWKKVLHETIVPKVESALGKDLGQALGAMAAPAQENMGRS